MLIEFKNASNDAATSANLQFDETSNTLTGTNLQINLNTDKKIKLGNSGDLEIFHDPLNSIIREVGTGSLYLQSNDNVFITNQTGNNTDLMASFNANSGVVLHWQGANPNNIGGVTKARLSTTQNGIQVEGEGRFVGGDVIAFAASDINLKENISPIENALNMINSLSGNTFTWKGETGYDYLNNNQDTGILAQEVEALGLPGITETRDNGVKAVRYDRLIPVLIEAIKELTTKVKSLESNK